MHVLRMFSYICFGALPASLSVLTPFGVGPLFIPAAIGLWLAVATNHDSIKWATVIVLLLLLSLLLTGPFSVAFFSALLVPDAAGDPDSPRWLFAWLFVAPTLVALHFLLERLAELVKRRLYLSALALTAGLVIAVSYFPLLNFYETQWPYLGIKPSPQEIAPARRQTTEFTLQFSGYALIGEKDRSPSQLTPLLAKGDRYRELPMAKIVHQQDLTTQVDEGGTPVTSPWDGKPSRYVVVESLLANSGNSSWPWRTEIVIRDDETGAVLGKRVWFRSTARNRDAWSLEGRENGRGIYSFAADEAKQFVMDVLGGDIPQPALATQSAP